MHIQKNKDGTRYGEEATSFLGCDICHDWTNDTVSLSVPGKITEVLDKEGMATCNSCSTPDVPGVPLKL